MSVRILVVDDNRELAENVAEILDDGGFVATPVGSPDEALVLAESTRFDVVILDVRMPTMDGIELRERLRDSQPGAAFVFVTAYASDDRLEAAVRSGSVAILPKPFGPETLVQLLRRREADGLL